MKRYEQRFYLLWVAIALLYPQTAMAASSSCESINEWKAARINVTPLLAEYNLKKALKAETDSGQTADDFNEGVPQVCQRLRLSAEVSEPRVLSGSTCLYAKTIRGLLPLERGPPVEC